LSQHQPQPNQPISLRHQWRMSVFLKLLSFSHRTCVRSLQGVLYGHRSATFGSGRPRTPTFLYCRATSDSSIPKCTPTLDISASRELTEPARVLLLCVHHIRQRQPAQDASQRLEEESRTRRRRRRGLRATMLGAGKEDHHTTSEVMAKQVVVPSHSFAFYFRLLFEGFERGDLGNLASPMYETWVIYDSCLYCLCSPVWYRFASYVE
jgi:hypothetical protein